MPKRRAPFPCRYTTVHMKRERRRPIRGPLRSLARSVRLQRGGEVHRHTRRGWVARARSLAVPSSRRRASGASAAAERSFRSREAFECPSVELAGLNATDHARTRMLGDNVVDEPVAVAADRFSRFPGDCGIDDAIPVGVQWRKRRHERKRVPPASPVGWFGVTRAAVVEWLVDVADEVEDPREVLGAARRGGRTTAPSHSTISRNTLRRSVVLTSRISSRRDRAARGRRCPRNAPARSDR